MISIYLFTNKKFVYPHVWVIFAAIHFFHMLRFQRATCCPKIGHQAMAFCLLGEAVVLLKEESTNDTCWWRIFKNDFEDLRVASYYRGECVCCLGRGVFDCQKGCCLRGKIAENKKRLRGINCMRKKVARVEKIAQEKKN